MNIRDHVFLVTGAASGLGAATAKQLVARGGKVVVADLNEAFGAALAGELGPAAMFSRVDVMSPRDVQTAIDAAAQLGTLRGVVHCAGILHAAKIVGRDGPYDLDAFRRVVEVNLVGTFNVLRLVAAALTTTPSDAGGERGVIINTASVAAWDGQIGQASYAASKAGVAALSLPAARELARYGIRVVAVAPGVFETSMMSGVTDELRQSLESQIPFPPRFGKPEEFASLVEQIIENPMHNGSAIRLDGALRMGAR